MGKIDPWGRPVPSGFPIALALVLMLLICLVLPGLAAYKSLNTDKHCDQQSSN